MATLIEGVDLYHDEATRALQVDPGLERWPHPALHAPPNEQQEEGVVHGEVEFRSGAVCDPAGACVWRIAVQPNIHPQMDEQPVNEEPKRAKNTAMHTDRFAAPSTSLGSHNFPNGLPDGLAATLLTTAYPDGVPASLVTAAYPDGLPASMLPPPTRAPSSIGSLAAFSPSPSLFPPHVTVAPMFNASLPPPTFHLLQLPSAPLYLREHAHPMPLRLHSVHLMAPSAPLYPMEAPSHLTQPSTTSVFPMEMGHPIAMGQSDGVYPMASAAPLAPGPIGLDSHSPMASISAPPIGSCMTPIVTPVVSAGSMFQKYVRCDEGVAPSGQPECHATLATPHATEDQAIAGGQVAGEQAAGGQAAGGQAAVVPWSQELSTRIGQGWRDDIGLVPQTNFMSSLQIEELRRMADSSTLAPSHLTPRDLSLTASDQALQKTGNKAPAEKVPPPVNVELQLKIAPISSLTLSQLLHPVLALLVGNSASSGHSFHAEELTADAMVKHPWSALTGLPPPAALGKWLGYGDAAICQKEANLSPGDYMRKFAAVAKDKTTSTTKVRLQAALGGEPPAKRPR